MTLADKFYITGGNVPADALSYVTRDADGLLLQCLLRGEFCYILTSRQMGKSSLMTQMVKRLRDHNVIPVVLDLSSQGFNLDARQWYNGLLDQLGRRLRLDIEIERFGRAHSHLSPLQMWQQALRDIVLEAKPGPITIFIDEIDMVRNLKFSADEFFAAIRACYNARTEDPAFTRINFCLLGVATPADLIANPRLTPFNVGTRIELGDFTRQEASVLEHGLGQTADTNRVLMDRIYHWTGGHPYLTQRLCETVAEGGTSLTDRDVDRCVERLFLSVKAQRQDSNIIFVQQRMLPAEEEQRAGLLTLYARAQSGKTVVDSNTAAFVSTMKLAGIVRSIEGQLKVRNRIYARVFDRMWIARNMPDAEQRRQHAAYRQGLARAGAMAAVIVAIMGLLTFWAFTEQIRANRYRVQAEQANTIAQQRLRDAELASYTISMNLIQREWDHNNLGHVFELLKATKGNKFRGFEWGYWNRLCHLNLLTLKGHLESVNAVAFSPDSKRIVTGSADHTAKVWDTITGRLIFTLVLDSPASHDISNVIFVAYSPDGKRIITGSKNGNVVVWDALTGEEKLKLIDRAGAINCCALSPDGKRIVTGGEERWPEIWNAVTGRRIRMLQARNKGSTSFAFSPDGTHIITGNYHGLDATVWEAQTGRELFSLQGHGMPILSVAYSHDGSRIVTGGTDKTTIVWDAQTGRRLISIRAENAISCVAFSADGKRILTGSKDGTATVWETQTGQEVLTLKGHIGPISSVAFSPDGGRIVTASLDKTAMVWEMRIGRNMLTLKGHTLGILAVAFSPDGKRVLSGSLDKTVKGWDTTTGCETFRLNGDSGQVCSVAYSPDGNDILTGSLDKTAKIWEAQTGTEALTLKGHTERVASARYSSDGKRIVTGSEDNTAKIWEAATGREIRTLKHALPVFCAVFSPDGRRIVTGNVDHMAKVWDAVTGQELLTLKGHTHTVTALAFSPDGDKIVTGSKDGTAKIWEAQTGREIHTLKGHTDQILSVAISPDGSRIVTGSRDGTAKVWEAQTGQEVLTLQGHAAAVSCVAFSPDGSQIVTGSWDKTARVWKTSFN